MFKSVRYWLRNALGFSKTEANGFPILVILVAFFFCAPFIFKAIFYNTYTSGAADKLLLDSLTRELESSSSYFTSESRAEEHLAIENPALAKFKFNPNTIILDSLMLLGIEKSIGQRIIKYRNAGGSYKIKSDLKKIYGLPSETYAALYPFIELPEEKLPNVSSEKEEINGTSKITLSKEKFAVPTAFDINEADTALLRRIYGIGPVLSDRLVKYRSLLGGFVRKEQIREVYGIKEEVFLALSERVYIQDTFTPEKININIDSINTIASHPYISYAVARAIYNYRLQHGKYAAEEDLLKIHLLDSIQLEKIRPYIVF